MNTQIYILEWFSETINDNEGVDHKTIYFNLPYVGNKGDQLAKSCIKKIKKCLKKDITVYFKIFYKTNKLAFFTNNKDHTSLLQQSNVVYEFRCNGCHKNYIGKAERTLYERCQEHGWTNKDKSVYHHLNNRSNFQHILNIRKYNGLFEISPQHDTVIESDLDIKSSYINAVRNNLKILDRAGSWDILLIKEGF